MVGADAPVGEAQHVGLVGDPLASQAGADEEVVNARVTIFFAVERSIKHITETHRIMGFPDISDRLRGGRDHSPSGNGIHS